MREMKYYAAIKNDVYEQLLTTWGCGYVIKFSEKNADNLICYDLNYAKIHTGSMLKC